MHPLSFNEMGLNIERYLSNAQGGSLVLDIGSMDHNGSYRVLIEPRFKYLGIDLAPGPNVDHVMTSEFNTWIPDAYADTVICGQVLEHCKNPFLLVKDMFRITKKDSFVLITAPWLFQIHRFPLDCWRILPDGMRCLIESAGGIALSTYIVKPDCWGIGNTKPCPKNLATKITTFGTPTATLTPSRCPWLVTGF